MPDTERVVGKPACRLLPEREQPVVKAKGRCALLDEEKPAFPKPMKDCRLKGGYALKSMIFKFSRTVIISKGRAPQFVLIITLPWKLFSFRLFLTWILP